MRILIGKNVLLVGLGILIASSVCGAQQAEPRAVDLGFTYSAEHTQLIHTQGNFWLQGGGADASWTLWKGFGVAASVTGDRVSNYLPGYDVNKIAYLGGPRYTFTTRSRSDNSGLRFQIFGQGLFGETHAFDSFFPSASGILTSANSFEIQAGGGANLLLTRHFGLRLLEADYVRTELPNNASNQQNALRLSAGAIFHYGAEPPQPVTLTATASPSTIYAGEPVTLTATAGNLSPKQNAIYHWSGKGVSANTATVTVPTDSLPPDTYTEKVQVKVGRVGKEGRKPGQVAEATASFTVKPFEPPTIGCSANPSSVNPGDISSISIHATSPQNRPLTYSYSTSAGSISGVSNSATLTTSGAASGPIAVVCNVVDDQGHSASATTSVTVIAPPLPPAPPAPVASSLCSISFARNVKRPTRVDNEAKACLDDIALSLQRSTDTKLALVGNNTASESAAKVNPSVVTPVVGTLKQPTFAALRAVNAKQYLVTEKGIDAARILVYTGTDDGKTVTSTLVPAGAINPVAVNPAVDENVVKAVPRVPLKTRPHKK